MAIESRASLALSVGVVKDLWTPPAQVGPTWTATIVNEGPSDVRVGGASTSSTIGALIPAGTSHTIHDVHPSDTIRVVALIGASVVSIAATARRG